MLVIANVLPLVFLGGLAWLLFYTLRLAGNLHGTERVAWTCLILLLFPLGSIIYLMAGPNRVKRR